MLVRVCVTLGFQAVWASLKTGRTFENTCWEGAEKCPKAQNLSFRVFGSENRAVPSWLWVGRGREMGPVYKKRTRWSILGRFRCLIIAQ